MKPLTVWEDPQFFKVGPVTEPQEKGKAIAMFPKSNPDSKIHAMLFRQLLFKWNTDNNKNLKNPVYSDTVFK